MKLVSYFRTGVSEIVSIALLVLMAVALGTALYLFASSNASNLYYRLRVSYELAMAKLVDMPVLDSFYNGSAVIMVIYVPKDLSFNPYFRDAYIDGARVPRDELGGDFNKYLLLGSTAELIIKHSLSSGTHIVKVVDSHGAEVSVVVSVE